MDRAEELAEIPQQLVGRGRELELALAAAARAPAAGLVAVQLTGEAGIGKSTLLDHLVAALGWRVWPVRADGLQRRIPYAALTSALDSWSGIDTSYADGLLRDLRASFDHPLRACDALTRLLTALAGTGPIAVAIDDVDQLDEDSQAMLAVCLRRLPSAPLAVLTTLRTGTVPLIEALTAMSELTAIPLGPLDPAELATIADVPAGTEVLAKADGNPFFAIELTRAGAVGLTGHEALLRRIALDPETRVVADLIAVFRRVRLDQLAGAGLPSEVFDKLVRHNVITLDGGTYRFTHAIVAEALYEEIGPARRRELHGRIAEGMLRDRGLAVDPLELAWHVSESARPGDRDAVALLTDAARQARSRAPERAAALCERALELRPAEPAPIESIRCRALARASRPVEAIAAGFAALAGLPAGPDREHTVTALVGSLFSAGRITEAIEVVDGEPAGPGLRASRALLLAFAGRDADALAEATLVEDSVAGAAPAERVQAFCQLTMLSSMLFRHERTAGLADQALAAAGSSTTLRLQALAIGASASALAGLVPDARAWLAKASDTGLFRGELMIARIAVDWFGGRWDDALRSLSTAGPELVASRQTMLAGAARAMELGIRSWRGELDLAAPLVEAPEPLPRNVSGLFAVAQADYWIARGNADVAERVITSADPAGPYGCVLLGRLIDLLLSLGRRADAALGMLTEVATARFAPWSRVSLLRATGLVHGDLDALRAAASEARTAELEFEWARAVLAAGRDVDELVVAYQAFTGMGADGLRREAGRVLRALGAKVPRARVRSTGLLTEAEDRIARLVRQGMRNREIAATLHYMPRSVEVSLSRIYAKLRISSRLELARMLDTTDRLG